MSNDIVTNFCQKSIFDFNDTIEKKEVEKLSKNTEEFDDSDLGEGYDKAIAKKGKKLSGQNCIWNCDEDILEKALGKGKKRTISEGMKIIDAEGYEKAFEKEEENVLSESKSLFDIGERFESRIIKAKVVQASGDEISKLPVIRAKACLMEEEVKNEEEIIKDRALRIAMDFAQNEHAILVGEECFLYNGAFFVLTKERELQSRIFKRYQYEIGKGNSLPILGNASKLIPFCITKQYEEFPLNSNLIIFQNGTLEINTGCFRKNSPNDAASSALGISYNPGRLQMPNTQKFLETIADGDKELYELMLQVIGYILSNDIKAKSFFYLEGVGDAGKSRFCDLVASFFPVSGANKVARIALQDLDGKFALGNLVNAKLNISEDLPNKPLSVTTVSKIKMLSDGNRQEAEAKYVQKFSFRPMCKLLFASNHPLCLKEYDEAFVNRVVYIPFLNAIPKHKQDRNILEKMQGELPALFNYAFAAYKRLVASGYSWSGAERFKPRIEITNAGIMVNKMAELRKFVEKCCDFERDYITATSELQEAYLLFCQKYNYSPVLGDRFSRELIEVLPDSVTRVKIGNQRRGFKGIRILHPYSEGGFQ